MNRAVLASMLALSASAGVPFGRLYPRNRGEGSERAYRLLLDHVAYSRSIAGECPPVQQRRMKSSRPAGVSHRQWKRKRTWGRRFRRDYPEVASAIDAAFKSPEVLAELNKSGGSNES